MQYDLQGVVVHTPNHYIAHVKVADGTLYGCNDGTVMVLPDLHFRASRWCLAFFGCPHSNCCEGLVSHCKHYDMHLQCICHVRRRPRAHPYTSHLVSSIVGHLIHPQCGRVTLSYRSRSRFSPQTVHSWTPLTSTMWPRNVELWVAQLDTPYIHNEAS